MSVSSCPYTSNIVSSSIPSSSSSSSSLPPQNTHVMVTRSKAGIFKPKSYLVETVLPCEPITDEEALSDPNWYKAMELEYKAILDNNTGILVPYSPEMKVISNKWVFKVKTLADGSLDKLKARLVAREFEQFSGLTLQKPLVL